MEKEKILEVKDLKVSFQTFQGSVQAVRGVSWHLNKKETIAIVGESGCGKTVTIQTVIGLNPKKNGSIKGGEVLFNKENLLDLTPKQMRKKPAGQSALNNFSGSIYIFKSDNDSWGADHGAIHAAL